MALQVRVTVFVTVWTATPEAYLFAVAEAEALAPLLLLDFELIFQFDAGQVVETEDEVQVALEPV